MCFLVEFKSIVFCCSIQTNLSKSQSIFFVIDDLNLYQYNNINKKDGLMRQMKIQPWEFEEDMKQSMGLRDRSNNILQSRIIHSNPQTPHQSTLYKQRRVNFIKKNTTAQSLYQCYSPNIDLFNQLLRKSYHFQSSQQCNNPFYYMEKSKPIKTMDIKYQYEHQLFPSNSNKVKILLNRYSKNSRASSAPKISIVQKGFSDQVCSHTLTTSNHLQKILKLKSKYENKRKNSAKKQTSMSVENKLHQKQENKQIISDTIKGSNLQIKLMKWKTCISRMSNPVAKTIEMKVIGNKIAL